MASKRRLRVFAGPNGSGKSTITQLIRDKFDLGVYVNADDIKKQILQSGCLNFSDYTIAVGYNDFVNSFRTSTLARLANVDKTLETIELRDNILWQKGGNVEDYFVLYIASYIREKLLETSDKFTFETVMSHPAKLGELRLAKEKGFKVYLYLLLWRIRS